MKGRTAGIALFVVCGVAVGCGGGKKRYYSTTTAPTTSSNTTGSTTSGTTGGTTSGATTGGGTGGTTGPGSGPGGGGTVPPVVGGTGVFTSGQARLPVSASNDWAVAAGDVDGDNRDDVVMIEKGGSARLLRNTVAGLTPVVGAFPATVMNATDAHLVDLDKDNDLDLVVASNGEPLRVFSNDGAGTFTLQGSYLQQNDGYCYKVAIGDANGDTYPDVYMAIAGLNTVQAGRDALFLADQAGGLTAAPATALPGIQDDSIGATFIDVDNDGDQDVFVANFGVASVLLVNNGAGTFTNQSAALLPAGVHGSTAAAAADVDRDGDLDLLVTNEGLSVNGALPAGEANSLLLNDGTGRFTDAVNQVPVDADVTWNVRLADVNGDQYPDAVLSNLRGDQKLWLNQQGVFVDVTALSYPAGLSTTGDAFGIALGDFNSDRAIDIIYTRRNDQPLLLLNTPR